MPRICWEAVRAANLLNLHHERFASGFYGGDALCINRWFGARADRGAFEVTADFGRVWRRLDLSVARFSDAHGHCIELAAPATVAVKLTATILGEYSSRSVFGDGDAQPSVPDTPGWHDLPWATAAEVLEDAEFNGDSRGGPEFMPPGIRLAYRALTRNLRSAMGLPVFGIGHLPYWCRRD